MSEAILMVTVRGAWGGAQVVGSYGSVTFQRGRAGTILRSRTKPTNPLTPNRDAVKQAFSAASSAWYQVLSAADRATWDVYAANTPKVNRVGDSYFGTGKSWWMAWAQLWIYGGLGAYPSTAAPDSYGVHPPVGLGIGSTAGNIEAALLDNPAPATGFALITRSDPQPPTRPTFYGPYVDPVFIDLADVPPNGMAAVEIYPAASLVTGQLYFLKQRVFAAGVTPTTSIASVAYTQATP